MKKDIINCFNLTGLILDRMESNKNIHLYVRSPQNTFCCTKCERKTKSVYDRKTRKILHGIYEDKKILLILKSRRFKCKHCQFVFTEPRPVGINRKRYDDHFANEVVKYLVTSNFKDTSKKYQVSPPVLLSILKERKREEKLPEGELILNVDEHSFSGRDLKVTVGEIRNKKILAVLKDDRQATLRQYFKSWGDEAKSRVKEVCIDMKSSYLTVIKEVFPNAKIVLDRFHVVKEMVRQVEEIRKIMQTNGRIGDKRMNRFLFAKNRENLRPDEREQLKKIFENCKKFPALQNAYFVKEKVREMYQAKNKKEAERKFDMLILQLEEFEVGKIREMRDTLKRWKPYILNFFESRTTNAFIEGCHNKIKLLKRMSYGFRNFNNYVLKITLAFAPFLFLNLPH
jgi:transposase